MLCLLALSARSFPARRFVQDDACSGIRHARSEIGPVRLIGASWNRYNLLAGARLLPAALKNSRWLRQNMENYRVDIECGGGRVFGTVSDKPMELGRQKQNEPAPYQIVKTEAMPRLILAVLAEIDVSRRHFQINPLANDQVRIANLSTSRSLDLSNGQRLMPGKSVEVHLPIRVILAGRTVTIAEPTATEDQFRSLAHQPAPPGSDPNQFTMLAQSIESAIDNTQGQLLGWLSTAMRVLQVAASAPDFLDQAAVAVHEIIGLSTAAVIMCEGDTWRIKAKHFDNDQDEAHWRPSRFILDQVRQNARTVWKMPDASTPTNSLMGVEALVAAPILSADGDVVGALYGDRRLSATRPTSPTISELEALLIELLASGVAAGLARVEQERKAMEARVQFEQYFTPSLARQLTANPELLDGRDADVSILFCDIRGFSRISQRLGPAMTMEWIGDVMGELSECVLHEDGVLVDYIGDELMAMWGAPEEQVDHAIRTCRAALAMLELMPELSKRWESRLEEPLAVGIGICSGVAHVGNTGTRKKFKYGPLGTTVNLASRIQGATKYLRTDLLVSGTTAGSVMDRLKVRRLARVQVVNVGQPVELFEVLSRETSLTPTQVNQYELALSAFERQDFEMARREIEAFLAECESDGPACVLLDRIQQTENNQQSETDNVWHLPGK